MRPRPGWRWSWPTAQAPTRVRSGSGGWSSSRAGGLLSRAGGVLSRAGGLLSRAGGLLCQPHAPHGAELGLACMWCACLQEMERCTRNTASCLGCSMDKVKLFEHSGVAKACLVAVRGDEVFVFFGSNGCLYIATVAARDAVRGETSTTPQEQCHV